MSPPSTVDELSVLVARARRGDPQAFDDLVRATYAETLQLARRLSGNEHDAGDIVQDSYLRAYRAMRRFRGESRFRTWLFRITVNCAASHASRTRRHRHVDIAHDTVPVSLHASSQEGAADVERRAETLSLRADLEAALGALAPKLRSVVVLRDVYDLSHEAIADELGISQAAAKVRLHRGRQQLRERLSSYQYDTAQRGIRAG